MSGTIVDSITKKKFPRAMAGEGGDPNFFMTGVITLRNAAAALAAQGVTAIGSPIITGLPALTNYRVGDYVCVSLGFPSATAHYQIIAKTASTLTLDTDAVTVQAAAVVSLPVNALPLDKDFGTLEGIMFTPNGGYIFDYDHSTDLLLVYGAWATHSDEIPLEPITAKDLGALVIRYIAWGS